MASDKDANRNVPAEIDAYFAAQPEAQRAALQQVRDMIRELAPAVTERVSYRIAMFRLTRDLVALSAHKKHVSLHTLSPALAEQIAAEFPEVTVSGATIQFTPERPLPREVVEAVVRARMGEAG